MAKSSLIFEDINKVVIKLPGIILRRIITILFFFLAILLSTWCLLWVYRLMPAEIRLFIPTIYNETIGINSLLQQSEVLDKNLANVSPFASALFGGIIASGITAFINNKMNKRSSYINTVTAERIKWLGILRENFAAFESTVVYISKIEESDKMAKEYKKLRKSASLLRLRLNPKDDATLIESIKNIELELHNNSVDDVTKQLAKLEIGVAEMLKKEWDKVKDESEKGRIS